MTSSGPGGRAGVAPPFEGSMRRLSRLIAKEFEVELDHDALKKLGYRADKRHNNPNTYYVVPGVPKYIENAPRVVSYIKQNISTKEGSLQLLGSAKYASHQRSSAPPTIPGRRSSTPSTAADDSEAPSASTAAKQPTPPVASAAAKQASPTADDATEGQRLTEDSRVVEGQLQQAPEVVAATIVAPYALDLPAGFSYAPVDKKLKVLEGLSQCINAYAQQKEFTAATLDAKGIQVLEEHRTIGERMRHAWIWWPGHTSEPLRCAQYMFCVRALLEVPACRQELGLPPSEKSPAAAAAAAGGSSAAPLQRKRRSDVLSLSPAAAAAAAGPARTAAGAAVAAAVAHKRSRTAASDGDRAPAAAAGALAEKSALTPPAAAGSDGAVPAAAPAVTVSDPAAAAAAAAYPSAPPAPPAAAEGIVTAPLISEPPATPRRLSRPSAIDVLVPPAADNDDDDDDDTQEADPEQHTSEADKAPSAAAAAAANDLVADVPPADATAAPAGQQQSADVRSEAASSSGRASRRVRTPQGRFARKRHSNLPVVAAAAARVAQAAAAGVTPAAAATVTPVAPAAAALPAIKHKVSPAAAAAPAGRHPAPAQPAAAAALGGGVRHVTQGRSKQFAAAVADNLKVLEYIDSVITQLAEALQVATSFTPAVLSSMPAVFTTGISGRLQDFLTHGTTKHQALTYDRATCSDILATYKADQRYRKTYLAYRAALEGDAAAAAAWLHGGAQQEMLEKLRVLNEFKMRWEEQRRNDEQARLREEALRKKELELQAAMEQVQREKELIALQKEQQRAIEQQQLQQHGAGARVGLQPEVQRREGSAEGAGAADRDRALISQLQSQLISQ